MIYVNLDVICKQPKPVVFVMDVAGTNEHFFNVFSSVCDGVGGQRLKELRFVVIRNTTVAFSNSTMLPLAEFLR